MTNACMLASDRNRLTTTRPVSGEVPRKAGGGLMNSDQAFAGVPA